MSLRERNRRQAMRDTQRVALDLFEVRGFDAVTVNEIAREVGIAASTIYRHFATKEAIVLWDEHEVGVEQALAHALTASPPFEAMRDTFVAELGGGYTDDLEFQLRRVRFVYATASLHAAAGEVEYQQTLELAAVIDDVLTEDRGSGILVAGAAMVALDVAFDRWQADGAATPLGVRIEEAFDAMARVGELR